MHISIEADVLTSLDDVEAKLVETEKEADKARKDSKTARDQFNDVKQRRYGDHCTRWMFLTFL